MIFIKKANDAVMEEKMCTVSDALDAGYDSTLERGDRCLTVARFLDNFSKEGYNLSVAGRSGTRLFPLSGIRSLVKPSLSFDQYSIVIEDDIPTATNTFTYEGLAAPWTVEIVNPSITGHATASVDPTNGKVTVELVPNTTSENFTCTIRLRGTRNDGGTLTAEFELKQLRMLITANVTIKNNTDSLLNTRIDTNLYVATNAWSQSSLNLTNRDTDKQISSGSTTWFQLTFADTFSYNVYAENSDNTRVFEKSYNGPSDVINAASFGEYWTDPYEYNITITAT